jgi:hypothetical protein
MRLGLTISSYPLLLGLISSLSVRGFSNFHRYCPPRRCAVNGKRCPILQSSTSDDFTPTVEHVEHSEPITNGQQKKKRRSHVTTIRSKNLASINADEDGNEIVLNFDSGESEEDSNLMVVVTGETGSGKSLLVSKAAELVTGGKMAPSLLNGSKSKSAESAASVELGT